MTAVMQALETPAAPGPLLEHLGLHQAAAVLPSWLDRAAAQELSYRDFLHGLLEEEAVARASAATRRRLREADFPYAATIKQFDFRFRPELKRQLVLRYLDPTVQRQLELPPSCLTGECHSGWSRCLTGIVTHPGLLSHMVAGAVWGKPEERRRGR